jgi:hypothetical protein
VPPKNRHIAKNWQPMAGGGARLHYTLTRWQWDSFFKEGRWRSRAPLRSGSRLHEGCLVWKAVQHGAKLERLLPGPHANGGVNMKTGFALTKPMHANCCHVDEVRPLEHGWSCQPMSVYVNESRGRDVRMLAEGESGMGLS